MTMQTFFTSDLHHAHKNIVKFTDRGSDTTLENHDEWLVNLWNSQVGNHDVVYHLGDFSFSRNYEEIAQFIQKLNGIKIFLLGNHDNFSIIERLNKDGYIHDFDHYVRIKYDKQDICMFHYPIASWEKMHYGAWQLYGHCHGSFKNFGKSLDVGLDNAKKVLGEHRLFTFEDISSYMEGIETYSPDHHQVFFQEK